MSSDDETALAKLIEREYDLADLDHEGFRPAAREIVRVVLAAGWIPPGPNAWTEPSQIDAQAEMPNTEELMDLAESAWGVIANAVRWRERYDDLLRAGPVVMRVQGSEQLPNNSAPPS